MAQLDIELPEELTKALTPPACVDLRLPKPSLGEIRLPTGGRIQAIPDITKGIPDDCAMNASIALQLAPMMASMECLLKVLKFLGTLISVFDKLSKGAVPAIPGGLVEIVNAGLDLKDCVDMVIGPLKMLQFVKDLLLLIAKMLRCAVQALKSVIAIMDGLEIDIASAKMNGNDALLQQLECSKENAELAAAGAMTQVEPVLVLLSLASPFFGIAGQDSISVPSIGSETDIDSLKSVVETLDITATTVQAIADGIPA